MTTSTVQWSAWNVTYDDLSPLFAFSPSVNVNDASAGWATVYVDDGSNTSYHYTSLSGASFALQYYGTNLTLYGSSNASYDVTFDGKDFTPNPISEENILLTLSSQNHAGHNMTFTVNTQDPSEQVLIDRAVITTWGRGVYTSPNETSFDVSSKEAVFQGSWGSASTAFPLASDSNVSVRATSEAGDTMSFAFNGRAIAVYGPVNQTSGRYSVRITGDNHIYNASSPVAIPETLLAFSDGHNESNTYTISLTNLDTTTLSISRIEIFQFNQTKETLVIPTTSSTDGSTPTSASDGIGSTPSSGAEDNDNGLSHSAVAGVAVASAIGVSLLFVASCLIYRKRRTRKWVVSERSANGRALSPYTFSLDPSTTISPTSYAPTTALATSDKRPHPNPQRNSMTTEFALTAGAATANQSTVERLLYLIANQIDGAKEQASDRQYPPSLPPYPETAYSST